jgi:hypothetical protein
MKAVDEVIPIGGATILWLAAQFDRTMARYENGESLVWRDAGCFLGTLDLTAEALGMSFCQLGLTGEPWISQTLGSGHRVVGAGGCLVGERQ